MLTELLQIVIYISRIVPFVRVARFTMPVINQIASQPQWKAMALLDGREMDRLLSYPLAYAFIYLSVDDFLHALLGSLIYVF